MKNENYHIFTGGRNQNQRFPFVLLNFVIFVACILKATINHLNSQ